MTPSVHENLKLWLSTDSLRADNSDLDTVGQEALRELMLALPDARPRPGFADRVMMASGLETRTWNIRLLLTRLFGDLADAPGLPLQAFVGVVLVLVGSAVASLPALITRLGDLVSIADLASATADIFTLAAGSLAMVLTVGKILGGLYEALLLVVLSPPMVFTALGALAFSSLTLRWLAQLLSLTPSSLRPAQRSSGYVPVH